MSLVTTASSYGPTSARQSRSTSAVFPDPTGPPTPMRTGLLIAPPSRDIQPGMESGVSERRDVLRDRRRAQLVLAARLRVKRGVADARLHLAQQALRGDPAERDEAGGHRRQARRNAPEKREDRDPGRDLQIGRDAAEDSGGVSARPMVAEQPRIAAEERSREDLPQIGRASCRERGEGAAG